MDSNNTPLQVYDIDAIDFTVVDESDLKRTAIEKTSAYVGQGMIWRSAFWTKWRCILNANSTKITPPELLFAG